MPVTAPLRSAMTKEAKWKERAPRYRRDEGNSAHKRSGYYTWRVPPETRNRTRPDHLRLDGQVFNWNDPPIHDSRSGERGHPGMDPHCRCYAEPLKGQPEKE